MSLQRTVEHIARMMANKGIKKHPARDFEYFSVYSTNIYDWELFFDTIALSYFGSGQYAENVLHWFLSEQRDDGFICRKQIPDRQALQRASENVRKTQELEEEELCKPFLWQAAKA